MGVHLAMAATDVGYEARRLARAHCEVRIFRSGDEASEADAAVMYWDRIPVDQRAEFVWNLSLELFGLAQSAAPNEPRFSRSVARVIGR